MDPDNFSDDTKLTALALCGYTIEHNEHNDFILHHDSAVAVLLNNGKWFFSDKDHQHFVARIIGNDLVAN